jgi:hypothetical protein
MWLINWLPAWFFHATFIISLVGLGATFIVGLLPFFKSYVLPLRIIFTVVLVLSTWFLGGHANEDKWLARVAELEMKIAESEAKSIDTNNTIVTKLVTRTKIIKEQADQRIEYIDREIVKYNDRCEIPKEFIRLLNEAAEQPK